MRQVSLHKLSCPASIVVIDGHPIGSGNIVDKYELVQIVLGDLQSNISFNIIDSPKHLLFVVCLGSGFMIPILAGKIEKLKEGNQIINNFSFLMLQSEQTNLTKFYLYHCESYA